MNKKTRDLLILHEGLKFKPYHCTAGKLTIGVGRNLDDVGISFDESMILLDNDIAKAMKFLLGQKWFTLLSDPRKTVVIDMVFNMGPGRFQGFKKFIECLNKGDFTQASIEMMDSAWADQVGDGPGGKMDRAERLSMMMKSGIYL